MAGVPELARRYGRSGRRSADCRRAAPPRTPKAPGSGCSTGAGARRTRTRRPPRTDCRTWPSGPGAKCRAPRPARSCSVRSSKMSSSPPSGSGWATTRRWRPPGSSQSSSSAARPPVNQRSCSFFHSGIVADFRQVAGLAHRVEQAVELGPVGEEVRPRANSRAKGWFEKMRPRSRANCATPAESRSSMSRWAWTKRASSERACSRSSTSIA